MNIIFCIFLIFLAVIWYPVIYLFCIFVKENDFLIFVRLKIGDVIALSGIFREIKKRYKASRLVAIIRPLTSELFKTNPYIDKVFVLENWGIIEFFKILSKTFFKFKFFLLIPPDPLAILLSFFSLSKKRIAIYSPHLTKTTKIASLLCNKIFYLPKNTAPQRVYARVLEYLGIKNPNLTREVFLPKEDYQIVKNLLKEKDILNKKLVVILPFAGVGLKRWGIDKYAQLIRLFNGIKNITIVVLGSKEEKKESVYLSELSGGGFINLTGCLSLNQAISLVSFADLIIGGDTGLLYAADALDKKTIDILGPSSVTSQTPTKSILIKKSNCSCYELFHAPRICKNKRNPKICLDIDPQEVFQEALKLL